MRAVSGVGKPFAPKSETPTAHVLISTHRIRLNDFDLWWNISFLSVKQVLEVVAAARGEDPVALGEQALENTRHVFFPGES